MSAEPTTPNAVVHGDDQAAAGPTVYSWKEFRDMLLPTLVPKPDPRLTTIADWLCRNYGFEGDEAQFFLDEARDLVRKIDGAKLDRTPVSLRVWTGSRWEPVVVPGPPPTWVDVFKSARAIGFTSCLWPRGEVYWGRRDESGAMEREHGWVMARRRAELLIVVVTGPGPLAGPWRTVSLTNPNPGEVLTAARLVGLGGDSDAR
jgi:hypothetical protein